MPSLARDNDFKLALSAIAILVKRFGNLKLNNSLSNVAEKFMLELKMMTYKSQFDSIDILTKTFQNIQNSESHFRTLNFVASFVRFIFQLFFDIILLVFCFCSSSLSNVINSCFYIQ